MPWISHRADDACLLHAAVIGAGPTLVLLHAGGPDHASMLPLAERLADRHRVVLPDLRGYGRSVCADPSRYTWARYTADVTGLLDHLGVARAVLGGAGLGSTITLRTAAAHPERVRAAVLIGVEDIEEDDAARQAEVRFLDAFAARVATEGLEAAWAPILGQLPPLVGAMVRDALPRCDPASIAAAAAIGRDRAFRGVADLAAVTAPALVFPGADPRHPTALARRVAATLPGGRLAAPALDARLRTAEDLAAAVAPAVRAFLSASDADPG